MVDVDGNLCFLFLFYRNVKGVEYSTARLQLDVSTMPGLEEVFILLLAIAFTIHKG